MEIWKEVEGTEGKIQVSNEGRVRSLLRGFPYYLKQQRDKKGYLRLRIEIKGKSLTFKVHRMVAKAFIPNPENLPQVNHIDGNKENNRVDNLEWISNYDNAQHAIKSGLWKNVFEAQRKNNAAQRKKVIAYKDNYIICFDSICDAQKHFDSRHITDVLKGKRRTVKGWYFRYESEVMSGVAR